ncbi:hypothetical protein KAR91_36680 [Candidatus Pacearchaeota archaeon]|nr:hypothetical protein [Candidatus Pacearchaeota archaeon]
MTNDNYDPNADGNSTRDSSGQAEEGTLSRGYEVWQEAAESTPEYTGRRI